jgi:hypothetical protein
MSAHIEWLSSRYTDVSGEAQPGGFENDGGANAVACLIITSQNDGHGIVIEGRPDNLLEKAREILRAAELLVEKTMCDPELRRLYGVTTPITTEAEFEKSADDAVMAYLMDDDEPSQLGMPEDFIADQAACEAAGQHVRSTRHTRWVCPFVTEVDTDA